MLVMCGKKGQIRFPANQNASLDANTLDDYEEGSWTPTIDSTNPTYGYQVGDYTKIGRLVFVTMQLALSNKGTGNFTCINGLPFMTDGNVSASWTAVRFLNLSTPVISLVGEINGNTIQLFKLTAAATSMGPLVIADLANDSNLRISGCYLTKT